MTKYEFSTPGYYRIKVQGDPGSDWSCRLGDMELVESELENNNTVMILEGCVRDQAALSGILNSLYELHLPLLSVEYLGNKT
jgi:hypothetical protein